MGVMGGAIQGCTTAASAVLICGKVILSFIVVNMLYANFGLQVTSVVQVRRWFSFHSTMSFTYLLATVLTKKCVLTFDITTFILWPFQNSALHCSS